MQKNKVASRPAPGGVFAFAAMRLRRFARQRLWVHKERPPALNVEHNNKGGVGPS
jgi:hypothetical protein